MKRVVLALALVGCNADLHHTVDAPPLDTPVDSLSSHGDPPAGAVKLTITSIGAPVAGAGVYFQGPDSSIIDASLTDEHGVAWALMPSGGFVTAREHVGSGLDHLSTFTGVQPSDSLTLDMSPTGGTDEHLVHITVPTDASAASYRVYTPCGEAPMTSASEDIELVGCGPITDIVVATLDDDTVPVAALFAQSVSIDGGPVTLTGTYQPLATLTLDYTNVPTFISFVGAYEALSATKRAYSTTTGMVPNAGAALATIKMPVSTGTELTATNLYPVNGQVGAQTIYNWHAATTNYALDVGSVLLPAFATSPTFDPGTRVLSWTERAGDQQPDVVRARIHVYRDAIPSGPSWSWRIVAPRTATSITYPKLPVIDNVDFNPVAGDIISIDELTTLSLPGGFAGFRTKGFSEPRGAIAGTLGRIVQQDLYFESL